MKRLTSALLLCLVAAKVSAVPITLTDVERVDTGRTAQCIYSGHGITRTVKVRASQDCKAAMTFENGDDQ